MNLPPDFPLRLCWHAFAAISLRIWTMSSAAGHPSSTIRTADRTCPT
jgi:hypothetical protein